MTTATVPVSWPTEETFKPLDDAFASAFNELEGIVFRLKSLADRDEFPDPLPTFETVGVLFNALDGIRMDLAQCEAEADKLEKLLNEVNAIRREVPVAKEATDAR